MLPLHTLIPLITQCPQISNIQHNSTYPENPELNGGKLLGRNLVSNLYLSLPDQPPRIHIWTIHNSKTFMKYSLSNWLDAILLKWINISKLKVNQNVNFEFMKLQNRTEWEVRTCRISEWIGNRGCSSHFTMPTMLQKGSNV